MRFDIQNLILKFNMLIFNDIVKNIIKLILNNKLKYSFCHLKAFVCDPLKPRLRENIWIYSRQKSIDQKKMDYFISILQSYNINFSNLNKVKGC